jgi:hypothetical protein
VSWHITCIWGWPQIHGWPGHLILITLESCPKDGCVGSFPEQKKWSFPQKCGPAVQAAPMMDYACPMWRLPACTHVRRLQVLQSKCLHPVTSAPWHIGSRQIHEDLWVPFFAKHIRALAANFDSNLADCGELLSSATLQVPTLMLCWPWSLEAQAKGHQDQQASRNLHKTHRAQHFSARHCWYTLTEVCTWFILGCKVNAKTRHSRIPPTPSHCIFTNVSVNSRMFLAADCACLGSKPRQLSNQSVHPK